MSKPELGERQCRTAHCYPLAFFTGARTALFVFDLSDILVAHTPREITVAAC